MKCFLLVFLLAMVCGVATTTKIEISPDCSSSLCVNMSNLVVPSSHNIEIVLLPGTHDLNSLSLEKRVSVSLVGSLETTVINCSPSYSANIDMDQVAAVSIRNIHFYGCRISLERCRDTSIFQSKFMNTTNVVVMKISDSFNTTISKSVFSGHLNSCIRFSQNIGLQLTEVDISQNILSTRYSSFVYFSNKKDIQMSNCKFSENSVSSSYDGSLISISDGIKINNCTFSRNRIFSRGILLKASGRHGAVFSGTHFIDNVLSSSANIIETSSFLGAVSCCLFQNNSCDSYCNIIESEYGTMYVTNTTFTQNSLPRYGRIISSDYRNHVVVISSYFSHNNLLFSGRVISGNAVVIASEFSNNLFFNSHTINSGNCSRIDNEIRNWSPICAQFAIGRNGVCSAQNCNECKIPNVSIALEFSQISISENIRHSHYAVQVCAVASNILWEVSFILQPLNGTATDNEDFKVLSLSQRSHEFITNEGIQSRCTFFEILDDERKEDNEYFTVKLLSNDPTVVMTNAETTVTIVDDDSNQISTTAPTIATTKDQTKDVTTMMMPTTSDRPTTESLTNSDKTVLVECGVYVRPVTFTSTPNNDISSLKESIVQTFPGLEQQHIGLLKVKSDEFGGKYIDVTDTSMMIESKSYMKVILFTKFDGVCTI